VRRLSRAGVVLSLVVPFVVSPAAADPGISDYRYFRALSLDLVGRMPTRAEVEALRDPKFNLDAWIDAHLTGPAYAERLRRIYTDLLRLQVGPAFDFEPDSTLLHREEILDPDGNKTWVYFRRGQRRLRVETDGDFCLTQAETGQAYTIFHDGQGTMHPVTNAALDAATVVVKPWWLYADYRAAQPSDHYADAWRTRFPGYTLVPTLLTDPDGKPTTEIRVCKEEAQTAEMGTIYVSGRPASAEKTRPGGRLTPPPTDTNYSRAHKGAPISCESTSGFQAAVDCGCGPGLERCMPAPGGNIYEKPAFRMANDAPLGIDEPFVLSDEPASSWQRFWWAEEAVHFLDDVFANDRDFREVLIGKGTLVNGPLVQFYRGFAGATCCGVARELDYTGAEPLFEPARLPALAPMDTARWERVEDRGPHASGILTMPIFLAKYGSRRARAHALFNAFECKDFVAENVRLAPSNDPNLTTRPGCSTCHATLEPMAAYFSRIVEGDWTYLPSEKFPLDHNGCKKGDLTKQPGFCRNHYDPAFADATHSQLRGAYASPAHAEQGPRGLADQIVTSPAFARCAAQNVAQSFLGRPLDADDEDLLRKLTATFVAGDYRMRPLVRELVKSDAYRRANDLRPADWRAR
jgi:hypothetical protein